MKILVVDDNRAMRQIVIRALRQAGFGGHEVIEAADGVDALASIATHRPDLILSDWNMPHMNGLDLLKALRESGDHTPFGFVAPDGSEQANGIAAEAGALFLITKPPTAEAFRYALASILS